MKDYEVRFIMQDREQLERALAIITTYTNWAPDPRLLAVKEALENELGVNRTFVEGSPSVEA